LKGKRILSGIKIRGSIGSVKSWWEGVQKHLPRTRT